MRWLSLFVRRGRGGRRFAGKRSLVYLLLLLLVAGLSEYWSGSQTDRVPSEKPSSEKQDSGSGKQASPAFPDVETCHVEWTVDGDTLIVQSCRGREKVRLIGCNSPETVKRDWPVEPYGPEASAFTRQWVKANRFVVTLVADGDREDKYGRRLAMVYGGSQVSEEQGSFLNEELLRQGLAKATLSYHFSSGKKDRFRKAEEFAQRQKRGMWSEER